MRPLARILLALSMGLASETIFAQEPAPDAPETAAPAPTPIPAGEAAPAETTLTAPADPMPSADAVEAPGDLAALAALVTAAQTPTPGPPETPVAQVAQVENRIEPPPPPPPAPRVEAAIGDVEDDAGLGRTATARDWFFVGVLALAIAMIALKLLRTRSERVSIHEDRRLGGLS
jgi:hypothetical protein